MMIEIRLVKASENEDGPFLPTYIGLVVRKVMPEAVKDNDDDGRQGGLATRREGRQWLAAKFKFGLYNRY